VTAADAPGVTRPPRNNETKASAFRRIGKPPATADDADVDAVGGRGRGRSRLGDNCWFGRSPRRRRPSIADNAAGGTRRPSRVKRDRSLKPYRHATLIVGRRRRR